MQRAVYFRLSVPTAQQRTVWGDQKLQKIKYPKGGTTKSNTKELRKE